jgi:lipopolysaccharide/colanic/teichoic acid biosynthesis glycosyltransferase/glycosyltransferase involved in cell wall biosynthesis
MKRKLKVLFVTSVDITVEKFLIPLLNRLKNEGFEVHVACSKGKYTPDIEARGFIVHNILIERRINPLSNLRSLWNLYLLMRKERFQIVHVHTPIASVLGRIAAWMARVPITVYTVHGFYFHENTNRLIRKAMVWLERILCKITTIVFTVSSEDAQTAIKEKICPEKKVKWISNGIDINRFNIRTDSGMMRLKYGLTPDNKVVGFVGRFVEEKGIINLLEAIQQVVKLIPDAKLLIVGEKEESDRDKKTGKIITSIVNQGGLSSHVIFTGFIEDVPEVLSVMDVFVLPSYREGLPISILEAMACGKPVIATNIRGCREEVIPEKTGLLVPVNDSKSLADAIVRLLSNEKLARQMGITGRRQVEEFFDEIFPVEKELKAYQDVVSENFVVEAFTNNVIIDKPFQLFLKRVFDVVVSFVCLALFFIPFLVVAICIKLESSGPVFFLQERVGKDGRIFKIWKFRTMVENAVEQGLGFNVARNDSRITRIGKILRTWGIDELPQLINVFTGEMSIVGPRPTLSYQVKQYNNFQCQRLQVKPGITCLSIIKGRNSLSWNQRIKYDVFYIYHWSLWFDFEIIFKTFWVILVSKKGIYGKSGVNDDFKNTGHNVDGYTKNNVTQSITISKER